MDAPRVIPVRSPLRRMPQAVAFAAIVVAPFGAVGIAVNDGRISALAFLPLGTAHWSARDVLAARASEQVRAYLDDPRAEFDLPLAPVGTAFQRRVWDQIVSIPSGQTRRYGELARELNSAARAVGQACGDNRYPLVIPCHRVVAATGTGGFAHASRGFHTSVKQWLLQHEQRQHDQH